MGIFSGGWVYWGYWAEVAEVDNRVMASEPLGLIAAEGILPVLVAQGAAAAGRKVVCAALRGNASEQLGALCDQFNWVGALRLGQWIRVLKRAGCREAIMVGRVKKSQMYRRFRYFHYVPDWRTVRVFFTTLRHDKRDHAVLRAVADELAKEGITLIDSTQYCQEHLTVAGVMTKCQPTQGQWRDIRFGWHLCRQISRMDIGQALAVLDKDVIAVEAMEGTDAMIERAGELCRHGGWTCVKVTNTHADMRMDVPCVGETTIRKLAAARAGCLVLEVGKTLILDKPKVIELAQRHNIAVVGFSDELDQEPSVNA